MFMKMKMNGLLSCWWSFVRIHKETVKKKKRYSDFLFVSGNQSWCRCCKSVTSIKGWNLGTQLFALTLTRLYWAGDSCRPGNATKSPLIQDWLSFWCKTSASINKAEVRTQIQIHPTRSRLWPSSWCCSHLKVVIIIMILKKMHLQIYWRWTRKNQIQSIYYLHVTHPEWQNCKLLAYYNCRKELTA